MVRLWAVVEDFGLRQHAGQLGPFHVFPLRYRLPLPAERAGVGRESGVVELQTLLFEFLDLLLGRTLLHLYDLMLDVFENFEGVEMHEGKLVLLGLLCLPLVVVMVIAP